MSRFRGHAPLITVLSAFLLLIVGMVSYFLATIVVSPWYGASLAAVLLLSAAFILAFLAGILFGAWIIAYLSQEQAQNRTPTHRK